MWKQSYKRKKLDQIIFKDLMPPIDPNALKTFSNIAFQCLHNSREQRPTISLLLKKLKIALKFQERQDMKLNKDIGTSRKSNYVDEMGLLLSKGKGLFRNTSKKEKEGAKGKDANGSGSGRNPAIVANRRDVGGSDSGGNFVIVEKGTAPSQIDDARKAEGNFVRIHDGRMGFTLDELLYGPAEIMGKSIYGTYYKGTLKNGDHVAVIRTRAMLAKNQREAEVELNFVGQIRHPNLLAVRAYFLQPKGETLFVYDYMPKGSLAAFLHELAFADLNAAQGPKQRVDWATRMQIAKGVARGLLSLHIHHNITHGNLTSSNIFLDENINPKISAFGLSQVITVAANSNMSATVGVLGYEAPNLSILEKSYTKTDVYSLGVIMLELLTGKSPGEVRDHDLSRWVQMTVREEWTDEVFDHELLRHTSVNELAIVLQLAVVCASTLPHRRPDVQQVLQQLEEISSEMATSSSDDDERSPSLS
ncbi:probable leucine-rich repeat receptor-like protein kinase IMK3 [Helianthus annuus]|uniref:probable leucine-rich repeat receptor-like protein kinase IMK3 n=1 Tax=Helianthus annuus TaxID=4232 RepID=UPI0016531971|nr:probable leucine-rich repeat receptor-like protein kinase IMK3 [Helianthus annuus]